MADASARLPDGTTVDRRYRIDGLLGWGGMGAVYEVTHVGTHRRHALKTMRAEMVSQPDLLERFRAESRRTARINSEHIVGVTDNGVDTELNIPYFVMDLLEGKSLAAALAERGNLSAQEVVDLLHQAGLALDKVHAAGIVHRDLKPENLFLTKDDEDQPCLKVLDFGIAKLVDGNTDAKTTRNLGTPLYMSPEQYRGDAHVDHRADLYSMGHMAFHLLTGHAYWSPEAKEGQYVLMARVVEGATEAASARAAAFGVSLPRVFDTWFGKATAKDQSDRFDTVSEMVDDLARALAVETPARGRRPRRERVPATSRPPRPIAGGTLPFDANPNVVRSTRRILVAAVGIAVAGVGATAVLAARGTARRKQVEAAVAPRPANPPTTSRDVARAEVTISPAALPAAVIASPVDSSPRAVSAPTKALRPSSGKKRNRAKSMASDEF